jgi:hypothetical protein
VDRLTAFVAIAHARLKLEIIERYHLLEKPMPTPKLQSLTKAMAMLEHNLEMDAEKLLTKIVDVGERGKQAFVKSHAKVDGIGTRVGDVEKYVAALEGANGGDPLDDSSTTSGGSSETKEETVTGQQQQSDQIPPVPGTLPQLTINGAEKA